MNKKLKAKRLKKIQLKNRTRKHKYNKYIQDVKQDKKN